MTTGSVWGRGTLEPHTCVEDVMVLVVVLLLVVLLCGLAGRVVVVTGVAGGGAGGCCWCCFCGGWRAAALRVQGVQGYLMGWAAGGGG